ncbi:MAG: hypothetical protein WD738_07915 [Pirellulales bacterium]
MRALKTMKMAGIAASLVLLACTGRVDAVSIPIDNHSFESPTVPGPPGNTWFDGIPTDWSGSSSSVYTWVEDSASLTFSGGDGPQHGGIGEDFGYIYQDLGVPFEANMTYRVDIAGAHRTGTGHAKLEFGVFSSNAVGTTLGNAGFIDVQGIWTGSGNPDADDQFNQLRDASFLNALDNNGDTIGSLGRMSRFDAGDTPPSGNVVVFIRHDGTGDRIQYDNIRLDKSPSLLRGDVNLNGDVDLNDLTTIRDNFRLPAATRSLGDLNEDDFVDMKDFLEWKGNYPFPGAGVGAGAGVPEPASWILGIAAGLLTACGRRRMRREHKRD